MTPEEWQRVRPILESALELDPSSRSSFLNDACADASLRRELESLIAAHEGAVPNALEAVAVPSFLRSAQNLRATLVKGTRMGDFEILSLLGAGGMGEVYRARDHHLDRDVAIKVLPKFVSLDSDRLRRFEQEAKAAAALNQPNILAVHQMGTSEGVPYLVSELLEGETLREQLKRGRLPARKAVDYGIQIARGLAAAHEKGIVHRDLKPENLFVTKHSWVKILDFGLAKLAKSQSAMHLGELGPRDETGPGIVIGTAGYMSPEQVRGQPADRRADIFAFGAILFEMLTGKRAFERPSSAETMAAIVNEDVPNILLPELDVAPGLQLVVRHCLDKDPDKRFQSTSDLAFALEALSDSAISPRSVYGPKRPKRLRKVVVLSIALLAVIGSVAFLGTAPHGIPQVESTTQLTNDAVPKEGRLATDGTRVYFNEGQSGTWRIAQVSVVGGTTAPVETRFNNLQIAGMAPDNSTLLVLVGGFKAPYETWFLPLPAGEPRPLPAIRAQDAGFFPDGRIVFTLGNGLFAAEKDGSGNHKLLESHDAAWSPSVSPDGKQILFDSGLLTLTTVDGKGLRNLLKPEWNLRTRCCGTWSRDGRFVIFQAEQDGRSDLWAIPAFGRLFQGARAPVRLTQGPLSYTNAIPSRDGKQIFAIGEKRRGEMVRYDSQSGAFVPYLSGISAFPAVFSADGAWVLWANYPDRTLWRSRADGSERLQLTYPPTVPIYATISPEGKRVTFGMGGAVYMISIDGGIPQKISGDSIAGTWSPDGNLLLLTSTVSAIAASADLKSTDLLQNELRIIDLRDGKTSVVSGSRGMVGGYWVTQDMLIAANADSTKFLLCDLRTEQWTELVAGTFVNWVVRPDRKYLYYTTGGENPAAWRLRFSDRAVEKIVSLKHFRGIVDSDTGTAMNVTPDGALLLTRDTGLQEIYALTVNWP